MRCAVKVLIYFLKDVPDEHARLGLNGADEPYRVVIALVTGSGDVDGEFHLFGFGVDYRPQANLSILFLHAQHFCTRRDGDLLLVDDL